MKKYRCTIYILVLFCTSRVLAAGSQTGQITDITVRSGDGLNVIFLNGTASGHPACATQKYWILRDENSVAGKKQLAMLILAQASNRSVVISGAGTCTRWPDGEDIESVTLTS